MLFVFKKETKKFNNTKHPKFLKTFVLLSTFFTPVISPFTLTHPPPQPASPFPLLTCFPLHSSLLCFSVCSRTLIVNYLTFNACLRPLPVLPSLYRQLLENTLSIKPVNKLPYKNPIKRKREGSKRIKTSSLYF